VTFARAARLVPRRRGVVVALVAVLVAGAAAWQARADNSLPSPGWAVTAAPTTALLDGDTVAVTVKANPDVTVYRMEVRECRLGPTYTADLDTSPRNGNCSPQPVSSNGDIVVAKTAANGLIDQAHGDDGATVNFHVGSGTVNWDTPTGTSSLTCDITTQCALVVKLEIGSDLLYQLFPLKFTDADPIVACGGTAPGVLQAAASDELTDAWAGWTRNFCGDKGTQAPSTTAFTGEGSAVNSFLQGGIDIAYGSAGLDPATGMINSTTGTRDTVAVPIALNAAVVAVGGGFRQFVNGLPGDKLPYPQLQMTAADAAALLGNGIGWFQNDSLPYRQSVLAHNPALNGVAYWTGANVIAPSLPLSSTYFFTKYFTSVVPNDWVYRRADPPTKRGASASLAAADPPFTDITTLTGRPAMGKVALTASLNDPDGPVWFFTDRATATALKLVPAALQNAAGTAYVQPDNASMTAAVAGMEPDASGVLQPQLQATTAADGVGAAATEAYPLTYVEYAFVPAEPLVDPTTCTTRTSSQALLTSWLEYITGTGQQKLSAGLEPLPTELQAQATAAIAKVGASPVTGPCAGHTTPESTPVAAGPTSSGITSTPTSAFSSPALTSPVAPAAAPAATSTADANAATKKEAVVAVPAFAGNRAADPVGGVIAIIGIVLLMSLAAWITAGGSYSGGQFTPGSLGALTPRRVGSLALLWGGVGVACLGLVMFQLGPLLAQRDQRDLLASYRVDVRHSAYESQGLGGVSTAAKAPAHGDAVGILEIGALRMQDVVVEGVTASQTREGPGHVPGSAGLGQPGNAVVVARRNGYGADFSGIGALRKGDRIVVTTTQGQSVYAVSKVCTQDLADGAADSSASSSSTSTSTPCSVGAAVGASSATTTTTAGAGTSTTTTGAAATTSTTTTGAAATSTSAGTDTSGASPAAATKAVGSTATARAAAPARLTVDQLYGPTQDDRLTLVTSARKTPWNSSAATVVVAKLLTKPFEPTLQGTREKGEDGVSGDSGAFAPVTLAALGFVAVIVASVALYRRMRFRIAYLLTIAPLVALTIVTGETIARLLPAWT
jgi:hypothetical protein